MVIHVPGLGTRQAFGRATPGAGDEVMIVAWGLKRLGGLTGLGMLLCVTIGMRAKCAADLTGLGYLDLTSVGADPSEAQDSTAAIQRTVEAAREGELVLFSPAATPNQSVYPCLLLVILQ